jgi:hypothetical protein
MRVLEPVDLARWSSQRTSSSTPTSKHSPPPVVSRATLAEPDLGESPAREDDMTAIARLTDVLAKRVPPAPAPVLIGGVYCLCVLAVIAIPAGSIFVTEEDAFRSAGP